jgi:acyl-CoA reductase-like NAD-dependent aldehyde dehydrogenase
VLEPVFEEFVERLVEETGRLRLGDPAVPTTDVGPMVGEVQRAKVERQLDQATSAGARVLAGGDRGGFERGWFLAPTVVVDVDDSMELLRTETFGPVAPVQRVGSLDESGSRIPAPSARIASGIPRSWECASLVDGQRRRALRWHEDVGQRA